MVTSVFNPTITAASTRTVHVSAYPPGDATCAISSTIQIIVFDLNAGTISGTQDVCLTDIPATINSLTPASSTNPTASALITYEWQATSSIAVGAPFSTLAGTSANYSFSASIPSSGYYQRVAKLTFNSVTVSKTSGTKALKKVINVLGGSVSPTQSFMCDGNPSLIEITGGLAGADYTYQWQSATTNAEASFTNLPAPSTASSFTPTSTLTVNTFFRRITTYAGSAATAACNTATSTVHTVNVSGLNPGSLNTNQSKVYCYGTKPQEIDDQVAASGQSGTISYTWYYATTIPPSDADWILIPTSHTDATFQPPHLLVSTWYRRGAFDTGALACQTYTNAVSYTILNEINTGSISTNGGPALGVYCVGDLQPNLKYLPAAAVNTVGTNLALTWQESTDKVNWTTIISNSATNNTFVRWTKPVLSVSKYFRGILRYTDAANVNAGSAEGDQRIIRFNQIVGAITDQESYQLIIGPQSLVVTATTGGIDTIDEIGAAFKTKVDAVTGYNALYDPVTDILQILKADKNFPNISFDINPVTPGTQSLDADVINSIDNNAFCEAITPILSLIVQPVPTITSTQDNESICNTAPLTITPVTFSWSGAIDTMRITGYNGITPTVLPPAAMTVNGAGDITISSGATTVTFSGNINSAQTIVFRSTGPCGVLETLKTYPITLESAVAAPTAIRKINDHSKSTVHTQGGKQMNNTVYVSVASATMNQETVNYHVCPDQSSFNTDLQDYVWSVTPPAAGSLAGIGSHDQQVQINWDQTWVTGLSGTGTTVTINVQSLSKCGALSAPLVTSIRLINADSATLSNTTPNLLTPAVTTAKCGWGGSTLLAVPPCTIFEPFGVAGSKYRTNKIQYFTADATTVINEYKSIEWRVINTPGAGSTGTPSIESAHGVLTLPSGYNGNIQVQARAIGFNGEVGNWSTKTEFIAPTSEIIPNITPTGLPDCPIPATGTYTSTLTADNPVQYFISSTSTLKTGTYSVVTGSFDSEGYIEIRGDATTSRTLDLSWKNSLAGNNNVFFHVKPKNCSRYVRNYIIQIPESPDITLAAGMAGFQIQDICEDDTSLVNSVTFNIKGASVTDVRVTQTSGPDMSGAVMALNANPGKVINLVSRTATITLNGNTNVSNSLYYITINGDDLNVVATAGMTRNTLGGLLATQIQNHPLISTCVWNIANRQLRIIGESGAAFSIIMSTPDGGGITAVQDLNAPFVSKQLVLSSLSTTRPVGTYKFTLETIHAGDGTTRYAVPTWCVSDTYIFTLNIHANSELTLVSSNSTISQNVCFDETFDNIVYSVTGAPTSISTTGLPWVQEGTFATNYDTTATPTPTYTISKISNTDYWTTRTFNYTVNTFQNSANCSEGSKAGTLIIKPATYLRRSSSTSITQEICEGNQIDPVEFEYWGNNTSPVTAFLDDYKFLGGLTSSITTQQQRSYIDVVNPLVTQNISATFEVSVNDQIYTHEVTVNGTPVGTILAALKVLIDAGPTNTIATSSISGTTLVFTGLTSGTTFDIGIRTVVGTLNFGPRVMERAPKLITITGTPTINIGTTTLTHFNIKTNNGCDQKLVQYPITIYPSNVLTTSGDLTDEVCANNSMTPIEFSAEGGNSISISVSPAIALFNENITLAAGTTTFTLNKNVPTNVTTTTVYTYTVTLTGNANCPAAGSITGTITVNPNHNITLISASGTDSQTICYNTGLTSITYQVDQGASGFDFSWDNNLIPPGITSAVSGSTYTISGTATSDISVATNYSYTVTTTGIAIGNICATETVTGSITVLPRQAITLASASTTESQTICEQTSIATITYNLSKGATGATFSWDPAYDGTLGGITFGLNGSTYTISGTLNANITSSKTYGYIITTNGNTCSSTTVTGTITVLPDDKITLNTSNDTQSVCESTPIDNIVYTLSEGATGYAFSWDNNSISAQVTFTLSGQTLTLSGTPTINVVTTTLYTYTVTTTGVGGCITQSVTGTISVIPDHKITKRASDDDTQQVCEGVQIAPIRYDLAEGATGFTKTWDDFSIDADIIFTQVGQLLTITGTPTIDVVTTTVYTYTVTTTGLGNCEAKTVTGTITVLPNHNITLNTANATQSVCKNSPIVDVVYTLSEGATGYAFSWDDNSISTQVTFTLSGLTLTLAGTPTTNINTTTLYTYTVTTTGVGTCITETVTGTITLHPDHKITKRGADDDTQTVCEGIQIAPIRYDLAEGATGYSFAWDDYNNSGVGKLTFDQVGQTITLSGTPTFDVVTTTVYTYTVTTTGVSDRFGNCEAKTVTGTITVLPNHNITLNTANDTQSVCKNSPIVDVVYTLSEGATGYAFSWDNNGISAQVTFTLVGQTLTLAGTPTTNINTTTLYTYTVTTTGVGTCITETVTGTITLHPDHKITKRAGDDDTQQVCEGIQIAPIRYDLAEGATGFTKTWDDAAIDTDIIFTQVGQLITITGTPTVNVVTTTVYTYTVTTTGVSDRFGNCEAKTVTGTITVLPDNELILSSGQMSQTLCVGSPITPFTIDLFGGATSYSINYDLSLGLTHSITGSTITVSGTTPSFLSTPKTYTVTYTALGNGCIQNLIVGYITVVPNPLFTLTSVATTTDQSVCVNTSIATITYSLQNDGASNVFLTGQPNGVVAQMIGGNVARISGTPTNIVTVPTPFRYKLTTTNAQNCTQASVYGFIVVKPDPIMNIKNAPPTQRAIAREVCAEQGFIPVTIEFTGFFAPNLLTGSTLPPGISSPTILITQGQTDYILITGPANATSQTFYVSVDIVEGGASDQFSYTSTLPNESAAVIAQGLYNNMVGSAIVSPTITGSTIGLTALDNEDLFEIRMFSDPESSLLTLNPSLPIKAELTFTGTPTAAVTSGTFRSFVGKDSADVCIDDSIIVDFTVKGVSYINIITPAQAEIDACDNTVENINYEFGGTALNVYNSEVVWTNNFSPTSWSMTSSGTTASGTTEFIFNVTLSENVTQTTEYEYTLITSGSECAEGTISGKINVFPSEYITHIKSATESFTGTSASPQGNETQVVCDGAAITPIIYDFAGSVNSYNITWDAPNGAPTGINFVSSAGLVTDSTLSLSVTGTLNTGIVTTTIYTYTINTIGNNLPGGPNCNPLTRVGSIKVNPRSLLTLATPGLNIQTGNTAVCNRSGIQPIGFILGGGAQSIVVSVSTIGGNTITFTPTQNAVTGQVTLTAIISTSVATRTIFPYTVTSQNENGCTPEVVISGQIEVIPDVVVQQGYIQANDVNDVSCFGSTDGSIIIPQTPVSEFNKRIVGGDSNIRQSDRLTFIASNTLNGGDDVNVMINGLVYFGRVPGSGITTATILTQLANDINNSSGARDAAVSASVDGGSSIVLTADTPGVPYTISGQVITSIVTGTTVITSITTNKTVSYSYSWTGPNNYTSSSLNISNLEAGTYTLSVTSQGCSSDPETYAFVVGGPLAPLSATVVGCDGTLNVTPSGGKLQYIIKVYQSGTPTNTLLQTQPTNGAYQFTGLTAGVNYVIELQDNPALPDACATSLFVPFQMPFSLIIDPVKVTITDDFCNETPTNIGGGSIDMRADATVVTGGSGNYSYSWTGLGGPYTGNYITNLLPGPYTLTVTDQELGCSSNRTFNIQTPLPVTVIPKVPVPAVAWYPSFGTATTTTVTGSIDQLILLSCNSDAADMEVQLVGNAGNGTSAVISNTVIGQYNVNWSKNGTAITPSSFAITNQGPGVYKAVTTLNGLGGNCVISTYRFEVRKPDPLTAVEVVDKRIEAACSGNFASLTFQISGGSSTGGINTISLNNGLYVTASNSTTVVIPQIDPFDLNTINTITISDNSGCNPVTVDIADIVLSIPEDVEIGVAEVLDINCTEDRLGSIRLELTDGTFNDIDNIQVVWSSNLADPTRAGTSYFMDWNLNGETDSKGASVQNGSLYDLKYPGKYTYEVKSGSGSNTCILGAGEVDVASEDLTQLTLTNVIETQPGCTATFGRIELVVDTNTIVGSLKILWEEQYEQLTSVVVSGTTTTVTTSTATTSNPNLWREISRFKNQTVASDLVNGVYRATISDDRGVILTGTCPTGALRTNSISIGNTGIQISNLSIAEVIPSDCSNLNDITSTLLFSITSNLPNPGSNDHFFKYNIVGDKLGSVVHSENGNSAGVIVAPPTAWDGIYTITGLKPDIYTLSVSEEATAAVSGTAATLCEDFYSFEVKEIEKMSYSGDTSFQIDPCSNEVVITANITGGIPYSINGILVYEYEWTFRPTLADGTPSGEVENYIGQSITVKEQGALELKVIDSRGCYIEPTTPSNLGNFNIEFENKPFEITPQLSTSSSTLAINKVYSLSPTCNGGVPNGQIAFKIDEGKKPYDISWFKRVTATGSGSLSNYQEVIEYKGTESQNNLESGDYKIIVRSQNQICGNTAFTYLEKDIAVDPNKELYFLSDPVVDTDLCLMNPGKVVVRLFDNQKGDVSFYYGNNNRVNSVTEDNVTYVIEIPTPAEKETLYVRNSSDCEISYEINIGVGSPTFDYTSISMTRTPPQPIKANEDITFTNTSTDPWIKEEWIFGDNSPIISRDRRTGTVSPVRKKYSISGTFFATLRITNAIGCDIEVTKPIVIGEGYSVLLPNVFTPNDDEENDTFYPKTSGLKSMVLTVYDSRGNLIWIASFDESTPGAGLNEVEVREGGFPGVDGNRSPYYIYTVSGESIYGENKIDKSGTFIILGRQ